MRIEINVVPEPVPRRRRDVRYPPGAGTVVVEGSWGDVNLDCGVCGAQLVRTAHAFELRNEILACARCSAYNEVNARK